MKLPKFIQDILTTADGITFDNVRLGMAICTVSLVGFEFYQVVIKAEAFDPVAFGTGAAALFAGGGAGIAMKKRDEP
jgi:hypothetical protein